MDRLWSQGLIFVNKVSREHDTPIHSLRDDGRFRATRQSCIVVTKNAWPTKPEYLLPPPSQEIFARRIV